MKDADATSTAGSTLESTTLNEQDDSEPTTLSSSSGSTIDSSCSDDSEDYSCSDDSDNSDECEEYYDGWYEWYIARPPPHYPGPIYQTFLNDQELHEMD